MKNSTDPLTSEEKVPLLWEITSLREGTLP